MIGFATDDDFRRVARAVREAERGRPLLASDGPAAREPAACPVFVSVTGSPVSAGLYDATFVEWDEASAAWTANEACLARDASGGALAPGYYMGRVADESSDGVPVVQIAQPAGFDLADAATAGNLTLASADLANVYTFTHTPLVAGGYVVTPSTHVWSEDDSTGQTLTIPAHSGEVEIEGTAYLTLSLSDGNSGTNFAPAEAKFDLYLGISDMNAGDDSLMALVLAGVNLSTGGFNYSLCTGSTSGAIGEASNNTFWGVVVPVYMRLPDSAAARRIAFKTLTRIRTDGASSLPITATVTLGPFGRGFTRLTARPV